MPGPMPPQGGAPQGAPAPQSPQPQGGGAAQYVSQINDGITKLKPMLGSADPQLKQAFGGFENAFHAFIAEAQKPAGGAPQPQAPQGPKPPMPANASANSKPMPPGAA